MDWTRDDPFNENRRDSFCGLQRVRLECVGCRKAAELGSQGEMRYFLVKCARVLGPPIKSPAVRPGNGRKQGGVLPRGVYESTTHSVKALNSDGLDE